MNALQEKVAKAIVNIFETGRLAGNYGAVVVAPGDRGHLSYGRSQATLASGTLHLLVDRYCLEPTAQFAVELRPYLPRLKAIDLSLDHDMVLRSTLARAGGDPVMRTVQDAFFDQHYWRPATRLALTARTGAPLETALGATVVYDGTVHGSFKTVRNLTNAGFAIAPPEAEWVGRYLATRRAWLAGHSNLLLRRTTYRMDALQQLLDANQLELELPLTVRGVEIVAASFDVDAPDLQGTAPERAAAHAATEIVLSVRTPYQTGAVVELLQHALVREGLMPAAAVDGIYGPLTAEIVRQFQAAKGLPADGVVGPQTWGAVED